MRQLLILQSLSSSKTLQIHHSQPLFPRYTHKKFSFFIGKPQRHYLQNWFHFNCNIMSKHSSRTNKIPKFIKKLNQILQDQKHSSIVVWLQGNNGFHILNPSRFLQEVLPIYFKHKNMASFVRQLNMYGFIRPKEYNQNVYKNARFMRGNFNSMRQISRKIAENKRVEESSIDEPILSNSHEDVSKTYSDLCSKLIQENSMLKRKNQQLSSQLKQAYKNQVQLDNYMLGAQATVANSECNGVKKQNHCYQTNLGQVEKKQQKIRNGFQFGANHEDWGSKLSYIYLIGGAVGNAIKN